MSFVSSYFFCNNFIEECSQNLIDNPFWEESNSYVEKLEESHRIDFLKRVLPLLGFCNLVVDEKPITVQIRSNLVREISQDDLRLFIQRVLNQTSIGHSVLTRMTLQYSQFFDEKLFLSLPYFTDFQPLRDKRYLAYRYYRNGVVEIDSQTQNVQLISYSDLPDGSFVWAKQVMDRDFDEELVASYSEEIFLSDNSIKAGDHFYRWCQNLCKSRSHSGSWTFNPQRFKALVSGFGYLLHQNWNEHKCVVLVDEDMSSGSANGRTGKSVVLNDALSHALNSVTIDAKGAGKKKGNNQFLFSNVDRSTQYICFDDACEDFDFSALFSIITGSLTVNKKYGSMFVIPKSQKPKISITSNHPITGNGYSYSDRQHIVEVGGFYRFHKGELLKDPSFFHGGYLFDEDWDIQNWKEFDAFCVNALRFYLTHGLVNSGFSDSYQLSKLHAAVGCPQLTQTLHRFLEDHKGQETYSKAVDGMSGDETSRCLREYVAASHSEEKFTQNQITMGLKHVAKHFSYSLNQGMKDRPQKRFGSKRIGVDLYVIGDPAKPFRHIEKRYAESAPRVEAFAE